MKTETGKIKYLYIITMSYFALGFVNITMAMVALLCMMIPFVLLYRNKDKVWCKKYCPRADYLSLFRVFNSGYKTPRWLTDDKMKKMVFQYFCVNLFFIIMSTFMVYAGNLQPILNVRFLIVFQFPGVFPQFWHIQAVPDTLAHLSFRLYSIMFTSTVLGTLLAILFKPRTWCAICPINTISSVLLKAQHSEDSLRLD